MRQIRRSGPFNTDIGLTLGQAFEARYAAEAKLEVVSR